MHQLLTAKLLTSESLEQHGYLIGHLIAYLVGHN